MVHVRGLYIPCPLLPTTANASAGRGSRGVRVGDRRAFRDPGDAHLQADRGDRARQLADGEDAVRGAHAGETTNLHCMLCTAGRWLFSSYLGTSHAVFRFGQGEDANAPLPPVFLRDDAWAIRVRWDVLLPTASFSRNVHVHFHLNLFFLSTTVGPPSWCAGVE